MKQLLRAPQLLLLALSLFIFNACQTDPIGTGTGFDIPPSINLNSGTDLLTGDATLDSGAPIKLQITASSGDNDMQFVEFRQDGSRISDISRITINGAPAVSNAPLLSGDEVTSFMWDVEIMTDNSSPSTYSILVSDGSSNTDQVSLTITIDAAEPTISFVGIGSTVMGIPGAADKKTVTVMSNGVDLANLSILQNGVLITDLTTIYYGDLNTNFTANPMEITGDDVNGFVKDIYVRQFGMGESTYTIQVENVAGKTASADYGIETIVGTAVDATFDMRLLSNAVGANLGGLDLYTGDNVSVNSADATIIDQGINGNGAATNWIQKFRHNGNGSVKELSAEQTSAGFAFDDVEYKEEILDLWDNAVSPANDQEPTNKVMVGDVFIISNDNDYFLLECTNVEVTTTNNSDFYNFKVKQAIF